MEAVEHMVGRDLDNNTIWVRGDGPYADEPGLRPAPARAAAARAAAAPPAAAAAADGPAEELDPFDEDEALLAGMEEEAEEAASVPPPPPAGLVGKDEHSCPIWVRGEGPYGHLEGLRPAPFVEPTPGPPGSAGAGGEEGEEEEDDDDASDSDRGRGLERKPWGGADRGRAGSDGPSGGGRRQGGAQAAATTSVWVGKLPVSVTMQVLHDAFARFGDIIGVNLQPRKPGDVSDGCGVVNFANSAAARAALQMMQGATVGGAPVQVRPVADPVGLGAGGGGPRRGASAGDRRIPVAGEGGNWECASCGNVNWPFRKACHRCKAARPGSGEQRGGGRTYYGGGGGGGGGGHAPKRARHAYNAPRSHAGPDGRDGHRRESAASGGLLLAGGRDGGGGGGGGSQR